MPVGYNPCMNSRRVPFVILTIVLGALCTAGGPSGGSSTADTRPSEAGSLGAGVPRDAGNGASADPVEEGDRYHRGAGVQRDDARAMTLYRRAADTGRPDAMTRIGFLYAHGQGVEQDYTQAMSWYLKAAELGEPLAMNNIGYLYEKGLGIAADPARAMHWYTRAMEAGEPKAANNLGHLYRWGLGVPRDSERALAWYLRAAEAGEPTAMYNAAAMYIAGALKCGRITGKRLPCCSRRRRRVTCLRPANWACSIPAGAAHRGMTCVRCVIRAKRQRQAWHRRWPMSDISTRRG